MKTNDSLGRKEHSRRTSGASSSLARSSKLFKKLRDLDRRITELSIYLPYSTFWPKEIKEYKRLDEKRKLVRQERKRFKR